jgi:hypothetical protein
VIFGLLTPTRALPRTENPRVGGSIPPLGAKCAEGAKQEILTQCPAERFCKLPGGEICVFGLSDASTMTQITAAEWKALVQSLPAARISSSDSGGAEVLLSTGSGVLAAAVIALAVTRFWRQRY